MKFKKYIEPEDDFNLHFTEIMLNVKDILNESV